MHGDDNHDHEYDDEYNDDNHKHNDDNDVLPGKLRPGHGPHYLRWHAMGCLFGVRVPRRLWN